MEEKKHILVDARPLIDPKGGGVRRVAIHVLEALLNANLHAHYTFVTTGVRERLLPVPFNDHPLVEHVHIGWPNKLWSSISIFGTTALDREIQKRTGKKFDAALLMNLGFVGFMEIPYALVLHDLSFIINPSWFPWKMRLWHFAVNPKEQAHRASRIFTVSETTARDAERLLEVPKEKIEVFHPGIPKLQRQEKNAPHAHRSDHQYVLALGESDPRKNASTAIRAVELLREDPNFQNLSIVLPESRTPRTMYPMKPGLSPEARKAKGEGRREPHGAPEWIMRKSSISDEELASLYEHASAFLYPSWYEGFGLPLHEAARFGIPCLASTHGALPETAPDGTVFIPPSKPNLWTSMLCDVLKARNRYHTSYDERHDKPDVSGFIQWIQNVT